MSLPPKPQVRKLLHVRRMIQATVDLVMIWSAAFLSITFRFPFHIHRIVETHAAILVLYSGLVILFCNTQKLYSGVQFSSSREETGAVIRSIFMAGLLLTAFIYVSGLKDISRFVVVLTMLLSVVTTAGSRFLLRLRRQRGDADGFTCRNVVIVGTGLAAQTFHHHLRQHKHLGYLAAGFIGMDGVNIAQSEDLLGGVSSLGEIARVRFIDEVVICTEDRNLAKSAIAEARCCGLGVRVIPDFYDGLAWGAEMEYVGTFPTMCVDQKPIPILALTIKRAIDITWSTAALMILWPSLMMIALAVKFDSRGPVFYTSDRVGRKGRIFGCHKFRTMIRDADEIRAKLQHLNERDGVLFKIANDPRTTRVGRILRKYSLDELPQLWNVVKGDMSLVGPRPPLAAEVRQYELDHLKRLDVMPGITGLWQVHARKSPSFADYIALDLEYVDHWSLLLDFRILLKTAGVVLAGTGQ